MEIGIGEHYKLDEIADGVQRPIGLGVCQTSQDYSEDDEIQIFKFIFDFASIADLYNKDAEVNGWERIRHIESLKAVPTRLACRVERIAHSDLV